MKLALFTLMSCLIAASWQQHQHYRQQPANQYWPLSHHYQQLPSYYQESHQNYPSYYPYYRGPYSPSTQPIYPNYYQPQHQQQVPNRSQLDEIKLMALLSQLNQQQQQAEDESKPIFFVQQPNEEEVTKETFSDSINEEDLSGRVPDRLPQTPENRGFLWPAIFAGAQILSTSTSYKFVTSTITSTSVISCIVSASFYGGSTQTCRRKRSVAEIEADEDQMPFESSPVNSVMPSVVYDELSLARLPRSADVVSSLEHPDDLSINTSNELRVNRALTGLFGSTITSTVTKYSISTTASKKTVSIGSSLSCLPSGYSVC